MDIILHRLRLQKNADQVNFNYVSSKIVVLTNLIDPNITNQSYSYSDEWWYKKIKYYFRLDITIDTVGIDITRDIKVNGESVTFDLITSLLNSLRQEANND